MAVRLSALSTGRVLLPKNSIYLLLVLIYVRGFINPRAALFNAAPAGAFLAPSVSTLFEPIINIDPNFKTKNVFECLSTVKYFHKISLKHGTVL
jgi:hypothetical protein